MNAYAYLATGRMISLAEGLSKLRIRVHGRENLPKGSIVFVVNHFTRIETLILPYHIHQATGATVWSLADASFFEGPFSSFLELVGAVSTRDPDRDRLVVKSLLTGEANWVIFPEGRMVKDKGAVQRSFFGTGKNGRPHSGAAALAMRTQFYRQRLQALAQRAPEEAARLQELFQITDLAPVVSGKTWIVPVNITYYPLRAHENLLTSVADFFMKTISSRLREEMLTEGSMIFNGVDVDIRFGEALDVSAQLTDSDIQSDIASPKPLDFDDRLYSLPAMRRGAVRLMDRYMAAIYGMTTVNHDHLFASLLRALPFRTITEDDFRRRVFLLASSCLKRSGVACHHSLDIGQVALLTDDRYNKFRDFFLLAQETAVLTRRDGVLVKDRDRLSARTDVHRIRLENPIGVIANEVVPLGFLQREVRIMAWLPEWVVRRRVAELLERQAREEFEIDYAAFYRPGETKERSVGAPVLLRGRSRRVGVVLVHGYLAAPREVAELAQYLQQQGYWVYQVRLKGHGTSPEDLARRKGKEWVESVDAGFALMNALCSKVVVGGFSFGGGVALDCASRIPVAGVFAVSPPHRLRDISSRFAPALTAWNRVMELFKYQLGKKEFVQTMPERPQINYARLPVVGLQELERFMRELEPKLPQIRVPTLVLQGDLDPVVDARGSRRLFELIGSRNKEYLSFPRTRHGILAGEGAAEIHAAIVSFLERIMEESPAAELPQ
ncbi:alpha/beta fold hydrolase [Geomesophilobacter sediminis]|uniref:Alpha/beta fold hydrolase n=1 Tax=Geomesophilobacter sediminis TaxID=2798584 RepID=A0A8J7M2Q1_9BACT|nr:alpha/beta fold hydrolase [Geomesophilobacter sediminis]MBJ6727595.1 alpha/beta fold hydrolase [Geomesophilobacter sediminis]